MGASVSASATDLIGLYVGAGVGKSEVRAPRAFANTAYDFNEHHNSWKAILGIRPLPFLGAEFEYLDFGKPDQGTIVSDSTVNARGPAFFGMLYAPLPVPFLDVYAKVGVARLKADGEFVYHGPLPVGYPAGCCSISSSSTDTGAAYGAGMQLKFGAAAVRAEYERIRTSPVQPDMLSLGFTWTL